MKKKKREKTGFCDHLDSYSHMLNALSHTYTQVAGTQTQSQMLVRCMVKKYIYWNLCQCRKNWKLALGFVTVPQVNIPAGAWWAETKPASLFGAVHLLLMATEKVAYGGLWYQTHRLTDTEKLGLLLRHTTSKCTCCTAINLDRCSLGLMWDDFVVILLQIPFQ